MYVCCSFKYKLIKNGSLFFCRSGYDHVLLESYLVPYLFERKESPRLEKRGNKVISIATRQGPVFRDLTKLLSPSTNLRAFGQLFQLEQEKAHFPFAFLDSVTKLDYPGLPQDRSIWMSDLNQATSLEEVMHHIELAEQLFQQQGCQTLGDYLKVYLRLDTEILYKAARLWRLRLKEVINIDFLEHRKFTISSLSYYAGLRKSVDLVRLGTFFPNNSQTYRILRQGMRG